MSLMTGEVIDAFTRAECNPNLRNEAECPICRKGRTVKVSQIKGRIGITCRTGCGQTEIAERLGITLSDQERSSEPSEHLAKIGANVVRIADVKVEKVSWLWCGRIPMGKITLIDGDPGIGKSTLTATIAAAVTRGEPLPGGTDLMEPSCVVLVSLEDGAADTIRPRLEAAMADLNRVFVIAGIGKHDRTPSIPEDLGEIEAVITRKGAKLLVLDPIMGVLSGSVNGYRDQDVRRALAPLNKIAERTGCAIVVVRHLNKNTDAPAMYRGGGSIGIIGAARSGLLMSTHPEAVGDDDSRRLLAPVKGNLAPPGARRTLEMRLVPSPRNPDVAVIVWCGESSLTAAQLLARPESGSSEESAGAVGEAADWLRDQLGDTQRRVPDLKAAAKEAGIAWRTVERAKQRIGVHAGKLDYRDGWGWRLPKTAKPTDLAAFAKTANRTSSQPLDTTRKTAKIVEDRQHFVADDLEPTLESTSPGMPSAFGGHHEK